MAPKRLTPPQRKAALRASKAKYRASAKGKATDAAYAQRPRTKEAREARALWLKEYRTRPDVVAKQRQRKAQYNASAKGKAANAAYKARNADKTKEQAAQRKLDGRAKAANARYLAKPDKREMNREANRRRFTTPEGKLIARANCAARRARVKSAPGRYYADDIAKLLTLQRGRCVICRTDISSAYHIDHIVPLVRGGSNWPENLQLLCGSCNRSKGRLTMDEFSH